MPQTWCTVVLSHQFLKMGLKVIPQNYRGVESVFLAVLEKLSCSILNQRFLEHVQLLEILHKSQIGFLANNPTADHVFTLRKLIDKYVDCHQTKVYMRVLSTLEKHLIRYGTLDFYTSCYKFMSEGNFYNLIKSLYSNSTCSIRIGNNRTRPFRYARGVRQGCILSPLLFNLYVND